MDYDISMFTKSDKNWLKNNFATKDDLIGLARGSEIDSLKITFLDNLTKWKSELFDKIDKAIGELKTAREENIILRAREDGRQEIKDDLDNRLKKLEDIHPNTRHQTT